mmetsp:Transcript_18954/g.46544  ORF Transcript_18954/g.46544 Transcript_18954/m.46544 type:complete len:207 (+) Transcript_18954:175-795(+)
MIQEFSGFNLCFNGKEGVLGMRAMAAANAMRDDGSKPAGRAWMMGKGSKSFSGKVSPQMQQRRTSNEGGNDDDNAPEEDSFVGGGRDRPAHITPVMKPEEKEARRRFMTKSVSWGPTHETLHRAYESSVDASSSKDLSADDETLFSLIDQAAQLALSNTRRASTSSSGRRRSSTSSRSRSPSTSPNLEAYKHHIASKLQAGCVVQF